VKACVFTDILACDDFSPTLNHRFYFGNLPSNGTFRRYHSTLWGKNLFRAALDRVKQSGPTICVAKRLSAEVSPKCSESGPIGVHVFHGLLSLAENHPVKRWKTQRRLHCTTAHGACATSAPCSKLPARRRNWTF